MTEPASVMAKLDELASELDTRSKELAATERDLEPVESRYEAFVSEWEYTLWEEASVSDTKWPPEKLRLRLAHRAMPSELLGAFSTGQAKRRRLERRISAIKSVVSAQQSILSALRVEAEAAK